MSIRIGLCRFFLLFYCLFCSVFGLVRVVLLGRKSGRDGPVWKVGRLEG